LTVWNAKSVRFKAQYVIIKQQSARQSAIAGRFSAERKNEMTWIILSNGEMAIVPEGADPDAVRQMQERRIAREAAPAKARRVGQRYRRPSRREQQYRSQAALTNAGLATLVERVNNQEAEK